MGSRLLCWVAFGLLGVGPADAEVTQSPRYLVKARSQPVTLRCSYESGHDAVYWYQQAPDKGPKFLVQYDSGEEREKGDIPAHFSVQQFTKNSSSKLSMSSVEVADSALYLCASSLSQPCLLSCLLHKNTPGQPQKWQNTREAARQQGPEYKEILFMAVTGDEFNTPQSSKKSVLPVYMLEGK